MGTQSNLRGWRWTAFLLGTLWVSIGCTPATVSYFLMPSTIPPVCKLAKKKEVTVCVVSKFATPELRSEAVQADRELAEMFAQHLRKRSQENKEKIKVVAAEKVRAYLIQNEGCSLHDIGAHFKADYVVALEFNHLSLYEKSSYQQLYRGNTEISLQVVDVSKPAGEGLIFTEEYRREFPTSGPRDASDTSVTQFRALFLSAVTTDLVRKFTAYPSENHRVMD